MSIKNLITAALTAIVVSVPAFSGVTTGPGVPPTAIPSNQSVAYTGTHTLASGDCGNTLALGSPGGTGAFYTITAPAVSSLPTSCVVTLINTDSGRGKTIAPNGLSNFILWPGQTATVAAQTGAWQVNRPTRWKIIGSSPTVYIDPVLGLDTNDGLASGSGGAVRTLQQAIVIEITNQFDLQANSAPQITVQLADGTYPDQLHYSMIPTGQGGHATIVINGNATTPTNVVITATNFPSNACIEVLDGARVELSNLELACNTGNILSSDFGHVPLETGVVFGATSGNHIQVQNLGEVQADASFSIAGNASTFVASASGGNFVANSGVTAIFTTNVTFGNAFVSAIQHSFQGWRGISFNLNSHTVIGTKFVQDAGSSIDIGGDINAQFPGSINGVYTVLASGKVGLQSAIANATKTTNYSVAVTDTGKHFDNIGAGGEVDFALPAAAAGLQYCFTVYAAQTLKVVAGTGDKIAIGGSNSASAGNITASAVNASVCVEAHGTGQWVASSTPDKTQWTVN